MAAGGAGFEQRAVGGEEALDGRDGLRDVRAVEREFGPQQQTRVGVVLGTQQLDVALRVDLGRREPAVEARQHRADLRHVRRGELSAGDEALERALLGQPAHAHEPVDGIARAVDGEAAVGAARQSRDPEIDVGREPPVEPYLVAAARFARLQGAEVQVRIDDGLLQLVRAAVGEEDPRHVRFARFDAVGVFGVRGGRGEEIDLGAQLVGAAARRLGAIGGARRRLARVGGGGHRAVVSGERWKRCAAGAVSTLRSRTASVNARARRV
jgi:hypothetical protein